MKNEYALSPVVRFVAYVIGIAGCCRAVRLAVDGEYTNAALVLVGAAGAILWTQVRNDNSATNRG